MPSLADRLAISICKFLQVRRGPSGNFGVADDDGMNPGASIESSPKISPSKCRLVLP